MRPTRLRLSGMDLLLRLPEPTTTSPDTTGDPRPAPGQLPLPACQDETAEPPLDEPSPAPGGRDGSQQAQEEHDARLAHGVARAVLEVLRGRRPLARGSRWVDDPSRAVLQAASRRLDWRGARLRRVHHCRTGRGRVEVCLVVDDGSRVLSLPMRLAVHDGRWHVEQLQLLLPPATAGIRRAA